MVSVSRCLRCLEGLMRIVTFLREANIYNLHLDFKMAERAVNTVKSELDGMVRDRCLGRETYDRVMHDLQSYLPKGVESIEEMSRLQQEFSKAVDEHIRLIMEEVIELCRVRE